MEEHQTQYNPPSLEGFKRHDLPNKIGFIYYEKVIPPLKEPGWVQWASSKLLGKDDDSRDPFGNRTIRIPEFRIPYDREDEKFQSLERKLITWEPSLPLEIDGLNEETVSKAERKAIEENVLEHLRVDADRATEFLKDLDKTNRLNADVQRKIASHGSAIVEETYPAARAKTHKGNK